jgi:hypothetical protein
VRALVGRGARVVTVSPKRKTLGAKTPQGKRFSGLFNVAAISANRHGFSLDYG